MEDYYEYLDSNGVTTLYKLIKDDTVALIDSYSVTLNGITTNLDNHVNNADIHTPIATIEGMIDTAVGSLNYATPDYVDTKISGLVNSAPETLDTLKELSDALGNDPNFATTVVNQIGNKASKDDVYTKQETNTLLESKANSVHSHVVSDITDFPTIPTKTSQLINDSGFLTSSNGLITSVSWSDITNKPNFSKVATSNNYNDLDNIPTSLPANGGNATTVGGFTVGTNVPADAKFTDTVYTHPSTHAASMITGLATVATSGSYNDLSNKPTIPNVYNKTLTIQKNGTNVATFTSNSNTDVTADITVPTKVSELSNDSGFITGISWDKVTNKPTLATVATSGSYTDLSNTPTIPTKVSQLENDMGFGTGGDTSDCVHKTGNETINGIKTFTSGPVASNNATTNGYFIKLNPIARNDVPTQLYHATFRAYDKNDKILGEYCVEKSTSGDTLLNMNVRSEDSSGNQIAHGLQFRMTNDGSVVRFIPTTNNKVHLGDVNAKWAKVYSDDIVHTSGNETINGVKMFKNSIYRQADISKSTVETVYILEDTNAKPCGSIYNKMHWYNDNIYNRHQSYNATSGKDMYLEILSHNDGSGVVNTGGSVTNNKNLTTVTNATDNSYVATMGWVNNPETSTNVVHRSGNETISGAKTFIGSIFKKNSAIDLQVNPSSNQYNHFLFTDKNNAVVAYLEHVQTTSGVNALGVLTRDKNNATHGIQVTSENLVIPLENNKYNLGAPSNKWANVYATTFNGNLKGNADTSTKASYLDSYSLPGGNKIYLDWDSQVKGYVGLKVDNTTMGGLITTKSIGSQSVNSATYATTQATTDNSTKIATTAWVRTYVNSVVGSGSIGASISAYYSNATTLTAEGDSSTSGTNYPSDYSNYINIAPTVGTIYTGSQLFSSFTPTASGTIAKHSTGPSTQLYHTTAKATANFSGAFSASAKYLCTTANTVRFRAYVSSGSSSSMGSPSVVDNSSAKSIFIRVQ